MTTPATTRAPAIRTEALVKSYPGSSAPAVSGLDLSVPSGSVYCLLGRNGAGKTTTIRMLTTLLAPTSGTAEVLGIPIANTRELRPRIGVALQEVALDLWLSAREQLDLSLDFAGWRRPQRRGRIAELVEQFGLDSFADKRIGTLSGGMRRRVDVALAVSHDPDVLFLDEPSSGLDIEGKDEVWKVVTALRDEGRTVVLTTHDMEEAVALSDHVGIIKDGAMIASGPTGEMTSGHGVRAHVTTTGPLPVELVDRIGRTGFQVTDADAESGSLTVLLAAPQADHIRDVTDFLSRNGLGSAQVEIRSTSLRDAFLEATR